MKTFQMRLFHILILACLLAVPPASPAQALGTIYVKWNAAGSNNGTSWTNAYTSLQSALAAAASGDEIWVAGGSYKPTTGTDRAATFQLESGVALYGGFAGTEMSRNQRDLTTYVTFLSGDIGIFGDSNDNSYHVVTGSGTDSTAILDGFYITAGNADIPGGGMYNDSGSPTLVNITFSSNSAFFGGGMYNYDSSPTLTNITFKANTAAQYGGGMVNYNFSSPVLTNVTFYDNATGEDGGGMYNLDDSSPILTNVTFSANSASGAGGGIYNYDNSSPKIRNTILWGNTASEGAQVYNHDSIPAIRYSVVQGGCPSDSACLNLITTDPVLDTLWNYGGSTETIRLQVGSSAIDAGNDTWCPATDQRGVARPQLSHCDIGAFEYAPIHYVKWNAGGVNNGTSWRNAYTRLQSALAAATSGEEIWVAAGTYKPTLSTDRTATFPLKSGVAVYGGFAGTETKRAQRDPAAHNTILSGDIGTQGDNSDNSCSVVTGSGTDNTAILDGFTITGGNANDAPYVSGGGMYNDSGSPTLRNLTFSSNSASDHGGGMYNVSGSPALTNVTFSGNTVILIGGGMYNSGGSPTLTNMTFSGNSASVGGGMHNYGDSTLTNVTFSGNSATNGGGINNQGILTLTNVTFSGNTAADSGGGVANYHASSAKVRNTILWGNTAPEGAQVYNSDSTAVIRYSVVQDGCPTDSTCSNLVIDDPLLGTLGDYGGSTETIPLQAGSSAIDAGNDTWCPATDQRGVTRPKGLYCDIGAFEFWTSAPTPSLPPDGQALFYKRPTFDWSNIPDATKYKLQASRSSTFEVLEINVNVTDSTYTPDTDLNANKEYFWRVKAQSDGIWSAWSTTWSFITGKPSSIPVLVSPADGTVFKNDYTPLLDWNDSTVPAGKEFDHYRIQIASSSNFSSIVLNENTTGGVTGSFFEPSSDLPANLTYYWRVRAYNTDLNFSSWSTVWSFRTALEPPTIIYPADEDVDVPRQPALDWSDVTDATGYKLVVSRYEDFSTPLLSVSVTDSIYHDTDWDFNLPRNKVIYWRVKALGDNPSAWTSSSFTTVP